MKIGLDLCVTRETNESKKNNFFERFFFLNFLHFFAPILFFATFFLVHFECEKTNRERERDDDVADDDFNDDSDDDENDRGLSNSTSFLLHAQSKRGGFLLLLLLEIVVENKDDDFLVIIQKLIRRGRAKALQKNVVKVVYDLVVFLFEKKKKKCYNCRLFLFV